MPRVAMLVEVEGNPNCETSLFARFKEIGRPRPVLQVRTFDRKSEGEWCWITGWQDSEDNPRCPAQVVPVEDSGAGIAQLVYGGLWGLRLKPVELQEEWDLDSPAQWGEPYLLLADATDVRYGDL
jgi:hypothetical protein